ncbi:uncharacterized protein N7459_005645 [Penicillium hispanicum]|uniref:uncharacterized protein n=1 Tax=Penicillium hispanicum TaxID=1080232 RepID=UPI002542535B|nr:uncharacterized protein N7459_005645 [Penicillium hispanicum]KAJ5579660.1 hypothetical protein N7459_005645 [Penicillium hispanicum]
MEKGQSLYRDLYQTVHNPPAEDKGPKTIDGSQWTVTELPTDVDDPLFPKDEEAPCDDDEVELYSDFALQHLSISWNPNTFTDIIAYLKSNSDVRYRNYYGPSIGVIVAKSIWGMQGSRGVAKWSDVTWPIWLQQCQKQNIQPSQLGYVIQEAISNDDTQALLNEFTAHLPRTDDDGNPAIYTWLPEHQQYYSLLASPNGIGTAYILLNYPNAVGLKYVSSITAFVDDYGIWVMTIHLSRAV